MGKTVKAEAFWGKFGVPARARPDWMFRFSESVQQEGSGGDEITQKSDTACKQQTAEMAGKRALVWWSFKIAISMSLLGSGLPSERECTGPYSVEACACAMEPCTLTCVLLPRRLLSFWQRGRLLRVWTVQPILTCCPMFVILSSHQISSRLKLWMFPQRQLLLPGEVLQYYSSPKFPSSLYWTFSNHSL